MEWECIFECSNSQTWSEFAVIRKVFDAVLQDDLNNLIVVGATTAENETS